MQEKSGRRLSYGLRSGFAAIAIIISGVTAGGLVALDGRRAETTQPVELAAETPDSRPTPVLFSTMLTDHLPARAVVEREGTLRRNSTLIDTLEALGAERREAYAAVQTFFDQDLLDARRLRAGLKVIATFETTDEGEHLDALVIKPDAERSLIAKRSGGDFFGAELSAKLSPTIRRIEAPIETSLYEAALALGAEDQQVVDFAGIFAFDVDFQREIHPGDRFEIVYEAFVDERGRQMRTGEVLYAALDGRASTRDFYRHTPSDDDVPAYFDRSGESATRFLMKTPINGARLSSRFGRRRHPISGYTRMHKGTDFAAPHGTPIYAAGNGVVERASRYGGYGHYVRIQHANGYETAYAHLSRYGPRIRRGRRVRQGDVIGYVGSTGASTGPHLHYEVLINGRHVNAMSLDLPTGRTLEGDLLKEFQTTRRWIDELRRDLGAEIDIAAAVSDNATR